MASVTTCGSVFFSMILQHVKRLGIIPQALQLVDSLVDRTSHRQTKTTLKGIQIQRNNISSLILWGILNQSSNKSVLYTVPYLKSFNHLKAPKWFWLMLHKPQLEETQCRRKVIQWDRDGKKEQERWHFEPQTIWYWPVISDGLGLTL